MHTYERNTTPVSRSNLLDELPFENQFQVRGARENFTEANRRTFLVIWSSLPLQSKGFKSVPKRKNRNPGLTKLPGVPYLEGTLSPDQAQVLKGDLNFFHKVSLKSRVPGLCLRDRGYAFPDHRAELLNEIKARKQNS